MSKLVCIEVENSGSMYELALVLRDFTNIGDKVNVYHIYNSSEFNTYDFRSNIEAILLMKVICIQLPGCDFNLIWEQQNKKHTCAQSIQFLNDIKCTLYVRPISKE